MAAKSGGKTIFCIKVASRFRRYPVGQKFHRNRSIMLCFAFNTEIQDGRQKWQKNNFCEKSPGQKFRRNRSFSLRFRDKHAFAFNGENQTWPPKVAGKRFLQKVTSRHPADQKFHRNRSILFCYQDKHVFAFNAEIQDGRQNGGKMIFAKSCQ